MLETDRMAHLDKIEAAAKACGYETRRMNYRSLEVIEIRELGNWRLFDPITRGEDIERIMFSICKRDGLAPTLWEFRMTIIKEAANDYPLPT